MDSKCQGFLRKMLNKIVNLDPSAQDTKCKMLMRSFRVLWHLTTSEKQFCAKFQIKRSLKAS